MVAISKSIVLDRIAKTYMSEIENYNAILSQMRAAPTDEIVGAKGICAAIGFVYDAAREHHYYRANGAGRVVKFCLRDELGLAENTDFWVRSDDRAYTTGTAILAFLNRNNLIQGVGVSTATNRSKQSKSYISTLVGISEKMKINKKKIKSLKSDVKISGLNNILNYFGLSYGKMPGAVNGPVGKDILSTLGLEEDETFFVENNRYYTYSDMLKAL